MPRRRKSDILARANAEAQRMIEEARASAAAVAERKTQQAIAEAEQIVAKAHEATRIEHDRMLAELKREVGPPGHRDHRQGHRQDFDSGRSAPHQRRDGASEIARLMRCIKSDHPPSRPA